MEILKIKNEIEIILDNNKAKNIVSIDLKRKSYIADYMIIASGTSSRHLQSLAENLVSELKKIGVYNCRIEGKNSNDWKLVDAIDIIIHIFHPEKREFYDLEQLCPSRNRKNFNMKKINTVILIMFFNILINNSHLYSKNLDELYEKIDLC